MISFWEGVTLIFIVIICLSTWNHTDKNLDLVDVLIDNLAKECKDESKRD